jgi:hypothetical protein
VLKDATVVLLYVLYPRVGLRVRTGDDDDDDARFVEMGGTGGPTAGKSKDTYLITVR